MALHVDWLSDGLQRRSGIHLRGPAMPVGGGSISSAYKVDSEQGPLFVKVGTPSALAMFEAEGAGLEALANADAVRVPGVVAVDSDLDFAYIVTEWIDFDQKTHAAERSLGHALALQHRTTRPEPGWNRDNTIGSTPQINTPLSDWLAFFCTHRLRYQLSLAGRNGLPAATGAGIETLLDGAVALFGGYDPAASLLHGDLWGGNWGATVDGTPLVFDPAVYYGDREADLAMTRLFGGFGSDFYAAYTESWPLSPGWERRVDFYNLYHLLNHFNLFGASYVAAVQGALDRLLRVIP